MRLLHPWSRRSCCASCRLLHTSNRDIATHTDQEGLKHRPKPHMLAKGLTVDLGGPVDHTMHVSLIVKGQREVYGCCVLLCQGCITLRRRQILMRMLFSDSSIPHIIRRSWRGRSKWKWCGIFRQQGTARTIVRSTPSCDISIK